MIQTSKPMKATVYFIVQVSKDYNNYVTLSNGMKLAVNNSIDSVEHINRVGYLVDGPKNSNANKGDMLLFHHNICRRAWGLKGKKRKSSFYIKDGMYYIPLTEIFMIKRLGQPDWEAIDPYVFIRPLEAKKKILKNGLEVLEDAYKNMKDLVGVVSYPNKTLLSAGIKEGDLVAFQQDSEFEFKIDGELHYRMKTEDVLAIYERPES